MRSEDLMDWVRNKLVQLAFTQLADLERRVKVLEGQMASTKETLALIDDALNRDAEGLAKVVDYIVELRGRIDQIDSGLAAQLDPVVQTLNAHADRLLEIGADPATPVPNPEPVPEIPALRAA